MISAAGSPDESLARRLDGEDPLAACRRRFHIPAGANGEPVIYFCGNSLGLPPTTARAMIATELDAWERLGVDAHVKDETPWYSYHELFRESAARLVGAIPAEVVMMNGLTVNLHLMLATFYRPTATRRAILIEDSAFPSDGYAIRSHIRHHGLDPTDALVIARARAGEDLIRTEDLEALIAERGPEIAVVVMSGVHYLTGQVFDMERIAAAARRQGCAVGFDLAHAAANVPLRLHDWQVDFAVWCSYKYVNAGPGAPAGCFVHERHGRNKALPRLAGWWGNDPETRFMTHLGSEFVPRAGADGWQLSNPPIFSMAPLRASLAILDEVGMDALRAKSVALTGYLQYLIDRIPGGRIETITPHDPAARGCQLSLRIRDGARDLLTALGAGDVVVDFREPDVIRVAPVPLYNTFHEVWRFSRVLARACGATPG
jgi:kynureninase